MRRLPLATFVAALGGTLLSAPALAEQGASNSQVVGGGSYVALDDTTVPPPVDACPNLDGIQDTVPAHMTLDPHGNCIHEPSHHHHVPAHHVLPAAAQVEHWQRRQDRGADPCRERDLQSARPEAHFARLLRRIS